MQTYLITKRRTPIEIKDKSVIKISNPIRRTGETTLLEPWNEDEEENPNDELHYYVTEPSNKSSSKNSRNGITSILEPVEADRIITRLSVDSIPSNLSSLVGEDVQLQKSTDWSPEIPFENVIQFSLLLVPLIFLIGFCFKF